MKVTQSCPTRDWIQVSHVADKFFTIWGIREAHNYGSQFSHPPLPQIKNWLPERLSDLSHIIQRIWVSQIVFVPSYTLLLNTHFINQRWMCELLFIRAWMLETVWVRQTFRECVFMSKVKSAQADSLVISWPVLSWWWSWSTLSLLLNPWCLELLGKWRCWCQEHPCV